MAFSKIIMNGQTLMDVTQDTVTAATLKSGETAHKNDGTSVTGTLETEVVEKDVVFIDYDGRTVASKTIAEINAMTDDTDLPANPTHTGLTAQGWNWTVAQLKAQLLAMPEQKIYVGQMYTTASGATEIDVEMQEGRLEPTLRFAVSGSVTVDWGDNTTADTVTGSYLTTAVTVSHTYASAGRYTIKILEDAESSYAFYSGTTEHSTLEKSGSNLIAESQVYSNSIKHIRCATGCKNIGDYSFNAANHLDTISVSNTINLIRQNAFYSCYQLKSITIPPAVTIIATNTFTYNYSLTTISIPATVTWISPYAFDYSYGIYKFTLPYSLTYIDNYAFRGLNNKEELIIPSGMPTVSNTGVFYNCKGAKKAIIYGNITVIGPSCFYGCGCLSKITIPSTVTNIKTQAFYGCRGMKEYHMLPTTPPTLDSTAFTNIPSDCIIYVPYSEDHSILNTYKGETNWSDYASYMQEEPAP